MDGIERVPEPIQWWEGMPLSPQHFQQSEIYWNARLRHQMFHLDPHCWGIFELKLDESAIPAGKIVVRSLHAVMPDGLIVQYPAVAQGDALELDVSANSVIRENKPLRVQLAAPVHTAGAASRAGSIQRYDSLAGALERDENTGEGAVPVKRLRARLSLQAGEQLPAKYVALPLLEIQRDIGGHFSLTGYHPPMLRISASAFLGDAGLQPQLERLAAAIRSKAKELLGATDETTPSITNNYQRQIVRQLVAALPEFELLARMPTTHPFQAYMALASLEGHMAGVGTDPMPMLLAPYRHEDSAPGLFQAIRHLSSLVAKLSAAYAVMLFERPRDELFTCELPPGMRPDRLIVEIKPCNGQSVKDAGQWLRQAYIGSAALIPLLRQRRIFGGRVRALAGADLAALGVQSGSFYEITNQAVQLPDKLTPVIQKDTVLHIEGQGGATAPGAIILYVPSRSTQLESVTELTLATPAPGQSPRSTAPNGNGAGHA